MAENRLRWREPTALLPLRWGLYRTRLIGGLLLIVAGGMAIAGSSGFVSWMLAVGSVVHIAGWSVLPSAGWRRVLAAGPATLSMWLLLAGPRFLAVLVLAYFGWLLIRHRPFGSYPTMIFVLAGAIVLGRIFLDYRDMLLALGIQFGVLVASAAAARVVHRTVTRSRSSPPG